MASLISILGVGLWGCALLRPTPEITLPEMDVMPTARKVMAGGAHPLRPYDGFYRLPPQNVRLVHTDVALRPRWNERTLEGEAELVVVAARPRVPEFVLDASQFELDSVWADRPITYRYPADSQGWRRRLIIVPGVPLRYGDTIRVGMRYRKRFSPPDAPRPWEWSDRMGMYWVNPTGEFPGKPRSLWTQGEVAYNSEWMPTIEHPRQKGTFTFRLTYDTALLSVANGTLAYSYDNGDGTRTDVWKMERPMSPYLAFVGIGRWTRIQMNHRGIPLTWIGERGYESGGRVWLEKTARMMDAFERLFDEPFPWSKYGQIVVRDFVAGGMENASITSLYEGMNHTELYARNRHGEGLIAHELGHQWWGDLVTLSSWPHLFINESWAEYSEYLWEEARGDSVRAAEVLHSWTRQVLRAVERGSEPIVNYHIADPEALFDAHRYPRGAHQLHGLRWYLGDSLFWRAARHLLDTRKWGNASLHDFISAFETTTGDDLEWLLYQLFLDETVPHLTVTYAVKEGAPYLRIRVHTPSMYLPVPVTVQYSDVRRTDTLWITGDSLIYRFARPDVRWFVFNAGRPWLMKLEEELPRDMAVRRFWECGRHVDRLFLAEHLKAMWHRDTTTALMPFARGILNADPASAEVALSVLQSVVDTFDDQWAFLVPTAHRLYLRSRPSNAYTAAFRFLGRYCTEAGGDVPACQAVSADSLEWIARHHPVTRFRAPALYFLFRRDAERARRVALADSLIHPFSKLRILADAPFDTVIQWWQHVLLAPSTTYHVELYRAMARWLKRQADEITPTPVAALNRLAYLYLTAVPTRPDQYRGIAEATYSIQAWLDPNGPYYDEIRRRVEAEMDYMDP